LISLARDLPSHGRGPRFDPYCAHHENPSFCGIFGKSGNKAAPVIDRTKQSSNRRENPCNLFVRPGRPPDRMKVKNREHQAVERVKEAFPK